MNLKKGFTLIEVLIVVTIVAVLAVLAMFMMTNNLSKSRDGKRKTDLDRIKIAFESYYDDENAFPPELILTTCGGEGLRPYLSEIPCDPKTKKPYCYIYDAASSGQDYHILSALEFDSDPVITKLECNNDDVYCGFETECTPLGYKGFNYGVSSSNTTVVSDNIGSLLAGPTPTPTPTATPAGPLPSTIPGTRACSNKGICNTYSNPASAPHFCPVTFADPQCNGWCDSAPAYALCAD